MDVRPFLQSNGSATRLALQGYAGDLKGALQRGAIYSSGILQHPVYDPSALHPYGVQPPDGKTAGQDCDRVLRTLEKRSEPTVAELRRAVRTSDRRLLPVALAGIGLSVAVGTGVHLLGLPLWACGGAAGVGSLVSLTGALRQHNQLKLVDQLLEGWDRAILNPGAMRVAIGQDDVFQAGPGTAPPVPRCLLDAAETANLCEIVSNGPGNESASVGENGGVVIVGGARLKKRS